MTVTRKTIDGKGLNQGSGRQVGREGNERKKRITTILVCVAKSLKNMQSLT